MSLQKGVATNGANRSAVSTNRLASNTKDPRNQSVSEDIKVAAGVLAGTTDSGEGGTTTKPDGRQLSAVHRPPVDRRKQGDSRTQSKAPRTVPPLSTLTIRPTVERLRDLERKNQRASFLLAHHVFLDAILLFALCLAFTVSIGSGAVLIAGYLLGVMTQLWSRRNG